ncbi:ABC transporter substrate-binding protein [Bradyrhizobium sp. UFLA05-153]
MKRARPRTAHLGSRILVGLIVACALMTSAFLWLRPTRSEALRPKDLPAQYTLKLNGPISPASAGAIVGVADGLYARAGLDVRVVGGKADNDAIAAVAADENTIGIASTAGFLIARSQGLPIVAFAGSYAVSSVEFFALPETTLLMPSDLEGKRIGYRADPDLSSILYEFIAKNSLAESKLLLTNSDTGLQDLVDRKIDVLLGRIDVEGLELARLKIDYKALSPASYGVHAAGPVYFVQERALAKRLNLERFIIATANGWSAAYSNYERTGPLIASSLDTPLPLPLISRLMDTQRHFLRPYGVRFGELDARRSRVLQSQLLMRRSIRAPVDLNRAFDYDVLNGAYRSEAINLNRIEP